MSDPTALPCASCGYDLRAQPRDGVCPECATPVQKAIELAKIPVRPDWRDSDPRWRRRMLAGAWVMVMVPLVDVLMASGLAARIPVMDYDFRGLSPGTLDCSFLPMVYTYLVFCIGVVLFFSRERFRRRSSMDWTRRWGVFFSYTVFVLGVPMVAVITSLVMVGISALFMTLPPENQPAVTPLVLDVGAGYLRYGPHGIDDLPIVVAIFSACTVLLACVPTYDALRSSGPKNLALALLIPISLIALWHIVEAAIYFLKPSTLMGGPPLFFLDGFALLSGRTFLFSDISLTLWFAVEAMKWLAFLIIAIWLTFAQVRAWRRPRQAQA